MPAMIIPSFFINDDHQARMIFLGMFILIGVTDKLDGTIARYLNQTSHLGAKLDTMADMVFYPLIALWLYRFSPQVVEGWWYLVYILMALFFIKMVLGKQKFGEIPVFHTIGGKTFAASLYFFMIIIPSFKKFAKFRLSIQKSAILSCFSKCEKVLILDRGSRTSRVRQQIYF